MKKLIHHKYFPQLVLMGLVFLLYGNTINHNYNFDDEYVVLNNQVQKGFLGIPEIFTTRYHQSEDQSYGYRPIAKSTFAIEYSMFGLNPGISHLINIILFGILILVCFQFLKTYFLQNQKFLALFICVLFIAHPTHTEVVASLKNREELLSFLFGVLGLMGLHNYSDLKKWFQLVFAATFFGLSILSKESGIILLVLGLVVLIDKLWQKKLNPNLEPLRLIDLAFFSIFKRFEVLTFLMLYGIMILFLFWKVAPALAALTQIINLFLVCVIFPIRHKKNPYLIKNQNILTFVWIFIILLLIFHYQIIGLYIFLLGVGAMLIFYVLQLFKLNKRTLLNLIKNIISPLILRSLILVLVMIFGVFAIVLPEYMFKEETINPLVLSNPIESNFNLIDRLIFSGNVVSHYVKMLFFPHTFSFYYGYNTITLINEITPDFLLGVFSIIILVFVTLFSIKKPLIFFSSSIILFGLIFFSNLFFDVPGIVGERLLFVPSFGFCILLGVGLIKIKKLNPKFTNPLFWILSFTIISLYSFKTIDRNKDWKNKATLYGADINHLENSARANLIYGDFLFAEAQEKMKKEGFNEAVKNQMQNAAFYYETSLKVDSGNFTVKNNLGTIYYSYLNKKKRGKGLLIESLKAEYANYYAYNNIGTIYANEEKLDSAIFYFKKGQKLKPDNVVGIESLGLAYYEKDNLDSAFKYFEKTLQKDPQKDNIHVKMGDLLIRVNQPNDALTFYNYALKINPNNTDALLKRENLINNEN